MSQKATLFVQNICFVLFFVRAYFLHLCSEVIALPSFTSSLLGAFPVTSADYSTFALVVAGAVAGVTYI